MICDKKYLYKCNADSNILFPILTRKPTTEHFLKLTHTTRSLNAGQDHGPIRISDVAMNRRWLLLFLLLSPAALLARADEDEVEEEAVVDDEGSQFAANFKL